MSIGDWKSRRGLVGIRTQPDSAGLRLREIGQRTISSRDSLPQQVETEYLIVGPSADEILENALNLKEAVRSLAQDLIAGRCSWKKRGGPHEIFFRLALQTRSNLIRVRHYLSSFEKADENTRFQAYSATEASLCLVWDILSLYMARNETAIIAHGVSVAAGRRSGQARRKQKNRRNVEMAREFNRHWSNSKGISRTALKKRIGKDHGLARTASIDAIDDGLKSLSGNRGTPDG